MNYNKTFVINKDVAATAAGVEMNISFPSSFMIRKMWVVTKVAGVAATHKVEIQAVGGTVYAVCTVGTTAMSTYKASDAEITEANRIFAGGTVLRVVTTNNESTGKYTLYIAGAHNE